MRLKKFTVLFPLCLCLTVLSACGNSRHELSGTYTATTFHVTQSYTFKDETVTVQFFIMGFEVGCFEGTYMLNEEETQITLTFDSNQFPSDPAFPSELISSGGTFTFQRGDGYILIGPIRYSLEKQETQSGLEKQKGANKCCSILPEPETVSMRPSKLKQPL